MGPLSIRSAFAAAGVASVAMASHSGAQPTGLSAAYTTDCAALFLETGQSVQAEDVLRQSATPSGPDRHAVYFKQAELWDRLGERNEARDALDKALRIKPDYAPARALSDAYSAYGPQAK